MNNKCGFEGCRRQADIQCQCTTPISLICNEHVSNHISNYQAIHHCEPIKTALINNSQKKVLEYINSERKQLFKLKDNLLRKSSSLMDAIFDRIFIEIEKIDFNISAIDMLITEITTSQSNSKISHLKYLKCNPNQAIMEYQSLIHKDNTFRTADDIFDSILGEKYIKIAIYEIERVKYESKIIELEEFIHDLQTKASDETEIVKYETKIFDLEERLKECETKSANYELLLKITIENAESEKKALVKEREILIKKSENENNENLYHLEQGFNNYNQYVNYEMQDRLNQISSLVEENQLLKQSVKQLSETLNYNHADDAKKSNIVINDLQKKIQELTVSNNQLRVQISARSNQNLNKWRCKRCGTWQVGPG